MVPEGWSNSLLDQVANRRSGHTPDKKKPEYWNGGIKWVSLADSNKLDNGLIEGTDKQISELGIAKSSAVLLPKGTVILSRDAGVGKSAVLGDTMAVSQHFIAWQCDGQDQLHNWFLYYWLQKKKEFFERQAVGSTIKTIGLPLFKKLEIAHPSYPEQQKIAEILSTWDRAIETAQALLATACRQKRALMQSLLTGKRRFPEFEGQAWREVRLGDVAEVRLGGTPSRNQPEYWQGGQNTWLSIADLGPKYLSTSKEKITDQGAVKSNVKLLPSGTVVMSFKLTIGKLGITGTPLYTNEAICGFVPWAEGIFDPEFLFQLLHVTDLLQDVDQAVKGKTLNKAKLNEIMVQLPALEEQKRIAAFLLTADREVENAETQIEHLRTEKKALMQQLLTGKKRVVVDA